MPFSFFYVSNSYILHWIGYDYKVYAGYSGRSNDLTVTTNSSDVLEAVKIYKAIVVKEAPVRSIGIGFGNVIDEKYESFDLFTDYEQLEKDRKLQTAILDIKARFGDNALLRLMDLPSGEWDIARYTLLTQDYNGNIILELKETRKFLVFFRKLSQTSLFLNF